LPPAVSIVTPGATIPWTVTTVTAGFTGPFGTIYDGANIWVTDGAKLHKLDSSGAILQTVTVGSGANYPMFDGANIWVPNYDASSVSVVRASSGAVLATLTGNGLAGPLGAAFDGQRVLIPNAAGDTVSLWKAAHHGSVLRRERRLELLDRSERHEQARPLLNRAPVSGFPAGFRYFPKRAGILES
jgi:hypothetical protein